MAASVEGFDHTQYEEEVRSRWGDEAWEGSHSWWSAMSKSERQAFLRRAADVNGALRLAAEQELAPESEGFQHAVANHHAWLAAQPNPMTEREAYLALADMYVADDRFAATYGGPECARRIRVAIGLWADQNL